MSLNTRTTASSAAAFESAGGISGGANPTDPYALWKPEKAARYLGMTLGWLAKMRMTGGGPRYVKLARRVYYRRADLDVWTADHIIASTSQRTAAARADVAGA